MSGRSPLVPGLASLAAGLEPSPGTPQALGEAISREIAKWAAVIKASGIKAQ